MSIKWVVLDSPDSIEQVINRSFEAPCLVFKHSRQCNISAIAKFRLEDDWAFKPEEMECYYVDVIAQRPISQLLAERFQVPHESPQVLLISGGECVFDASHLDITVAEIQEAVGLASK